MCGGDFVVDSLCEITYTCLPTYCDFEGVVPFVRFWNVERHAA